MFNNLGYVLQAVQYDYEYSTGGGAFGFLFTLIYLAVLVLILVGTIKVFIKAGRKWWEALIPFYNMYVYVIILGRAWWWFLLMFVPIVSWIVAIILVFDLAKAFGKSSLYALGIIFFPFVFIPVLGFGSAEYQLGTSSTNTSSEQPSMQPEPQNTTDMPEQSDTQE